MKLIKFFLIAVITVCSFMAAKAQVTVRARIGTRHHVRHRVVVVHRRPVYRHHYRRHVRVRYHHY